MKLFISTIILLFLICVIIQHVLPKIVYPISFLPVSPLHKEVRMICGDIAILKTGFKYYCCEKPVILISHGNGHTLNNDYYLTLRKLSKATRLPVISWDYPGYGKSLGKSNEKSVNLAYNKLMKRLMAINISIDNLIMIGVSIGTGPVVEWASNNYCRAVILVTPFSSIVKIKLPFTIPFIDMWNNFDKIQKIDSPILIFGALLDSIIPYSHSEQLAQQGTNITFISKNKNHNTIDWIDDAANWIKYI